MPPARGRSDTSAVVPPSSRRGAATEAAILDAVTEAVAEVGYVGVTVDGVAARARASKATVYRRWPGGKPDLVAAALRRGADGAAPPLTDTGSLRGDLAVAVEGIVIALTGRAWPSLLGLLEAVRDDPGLRTLVREQIEDVLTTTLLSGAPPDDQEQHRLVDDVLIPLLRGSGTA